MKKPKVFLVDVDGVLTTGQFLYTENGKTMKMFGPDDHLVLLMCGGNDSVANLVNYAQMA